MQLPTWPFKLAVACASVLILAELLARLLRDYRAQAGSAPATRAATLLIGVGLVVGAVLAAQGLAGMGLDRMAIGIAALGIVVVEILRVALETI